MKKTNSMNKAYMIISALAGIFTALMYISSCGDMSGNKEQATDTITKDSITIAKEVQAELDSIKLISHDSTDKAGI